VAPDSSWRNSTNAVMVLLQWLVMLPGLCVRPHFGQPHP
jgi:hypothetical protein